MILADNEHEEVPWVAFASFSWSATHFAAFWMKPHRRQADRLGTSSTSVRKAAHFKARLRQFDCRQAKKCVRERLNGCVACLDLDDCRQSQIEILMQICVLLARRTVARLQDQQTMMQIAVQLLVSRAERQNHDVVDG